MVRHKTARKNVLSGTEIRKCNIRKCAFGRALNTEVSLRTPMSGFLREGRYCTETGIVGKVRLNIIRNTILLD